MSNVADDASSMSDDVFEDPETTQRRVEERRRNEYANADYYARSSAYALDRDYYAQHHGHGHGHGQSAAAGGHERSARHDAGTAAVPVAPVAPVAPVGASMAGFRTASPSGYPGYRPPREARQLYALGDGAYDDDRYEDDDDNDGWKSYKYEDFEPPFDDTVNHKTILLGDSGVGKTSFLVKYNTGEFRAGSFSATVGIALTVMLLGDSGVGKTCLLVRFRDGTFLSGNFISTVGIDFRNKVVLVDSTRVKLQIWDTAGQERFRSVTHAYYRDAHALLLLYDVTNKTSFDNIRAWLVEIREYAQEDVVIMLLGNKADCSSSDRQVKREEGERLAREYNVAFMETSAKTGLNVELAFLAVARQLKCRRNESIDEAKFNVQDFVREQTQAKQTCPQCNM